MVPDSVTFIGELDAWTTRIRLAQPIARILVAQRMIDELRTAFETAAGGKLVATRCEHVTVRQNETEFGRIDLAGYFTDGGRPFAVSSGLVPPGASLAGAARQTAAALLAVAGAHAPFPPNQAITPKGPSMSIGKIKAVVERRAQFQAGLGRDLDAVMARYDELDRMKASAIAGHHAYADGVKADLAADEAAMALLTNLPLDGSAKGQ